MTVLFAPLNSRKAVRPRLGVERKVAEAGPKPPAQRVEEGPRDRGDPDDRQVERAEKPRLQGMTVLVAQERFVGSEMDEKVATEAHSAPAGEAAKSDRPPREIDASRADPCGSRDPRRARPHEEREKRSGEVLRELPGVAEQAGERLQRVPLRYGALGASAERVSSPRPRVSGRRTSATSAPAR